MRLSEIIQGLVKCVSRFSTVIRKPKCLAACQRFTREYAEKGFESKTSFWFPNCAFNLQKISLARTLFLRCTYNFAEQLQKWKGFQLDKMVKNAPETS